MTKTFYRPELWDFPVLDKILRDLRDALEELAQGNLSPEAQKELFQNLLDEGKPFPKDPQRVFWGIAEPDTMPADGRVRYFYRPTYLAVAILALGVLRDPSLLQTLPGLEETLKKGLHGATGRSFLGAGADTLDGRLQALEIFAQGGLPEFCRQYPDFCRTFTDLLQASMEELDTLLARRKVQNEWREDYTRQAEAVQALLQKSPWKHQIFVYGTLLQGNRNHEHYLQGSTYLGDGILPDYALYDLGSYPGVKPCPGGKVMGEIYGVDDETLQRIHGLEGEGELYHYRKRAVLSLGHLLPEVGVYEYAKGVEESRRVSLADQPWGRPRQERENLVWYAAYGSNLLEERFLCYLQGTAFRGQGRAPESCSDPSIPRAKMLCRIPHDVYFAQTSSSWEGRGVAFLDGTKPGKAYGVAYLITREQFDHLWREENGGRIPSPGSSWYSHQVSLGTLHGIPWMTVTNGRVLAKNPSGYRYLSILQEGLQENYPHRSQQDLRDYLASR
ncbi:gamma-glutamylcyclotransferase [Proteiniclasticum sp. BAD-10]|uniref:Gamma-glutamylcyclotransferase n=1 Tax=Proteiniclasticum sediminis TaxID=2804028 RepID=A0A941CLR5_9CLOT|nr:gamma-glutamylcyclotransferase family protein [Proteiniclasticum sediminis]MBR0574981.1 gamma-glutamylcyclotransferase [Proteiniclasticum sediminis]